MINMRIKQLFFDRLPVMRAVDRAKRIVLSKAGAFIRQRAKTSIRKRKGTSSPGEPPYSHEGSLRRFIFFGYDPGSESVVIGPMSFKRSDAPRVLEFGGATEIQRFDVRSRKRTKRKVKIAARPFMGPAMEKEKAALPKLWRNSVSGG